MIKKNGTELSIAPTSFAATAALFALCNLSLSATGLPAQLSYKSYSLVEEASDTDTTSSLTSPVSAEYYNTSTAREKLWSIFGETRDLTEEESDIYNDWLNAEAEDTGERLF